MNLVVAIFAALLFFVLSPGVLLRLPSNGSKMTVAAVHAVVFGILLYFTAGFVWALSNNLFEQKQEDFSFLHEDDEKDEDHEKDEKDEKDE